MCSELVSHCYNVATLRTCTFEITNEFAKCCVLLTAYIQITVSLSYLLEPRANKSLELIHLIFTDWSFTFTNARRLIINLHNLQMDIFLVVINEIPYEISFVLQPHIFIHNTAAHISDSTLHKRGVSAYGVKTR